MWASLFSSAKHLSLTKHRSCFKIACFLLLSGITIRLLPYLALIRASSLVQDDQAVEFRDRNGLPLGTLLTRDQDHTAVVRLSDVSPYLTQAVLAAEDQGFYHHGAVDLKAGVRAIAEAVQARRIVSGASTITMQLARMIEPLPRTAGGKVQEIWLSWRLEAGMGKGDILQAYLNRLPMGGNIYGVEAAARVYFGVGARDVNLAQASLLAALPNDPNHLNPYEHWKSLKQRQTYVLNRMVQDGYITQAQHDRAFAEVVTLHPRQQGILAAPHFLFWTASQLPKNHPAQIRTTLDLPLQQFIEAQARRLIDTLAANNVHQAAAIVLENRTGNVLAYVGSTDYFTTSQMGQNDGVQALRQPGSTLKPFLYELALEKRIIQPNTVLADVPTHYAIPGAKLYSPTDYSETFQGPVRVRIALANSLNVPAVRVLEKVGVATFLDRLHQLGFTHLDRSPEYYGLGLTLGSGEVSLWELAQAYRGMAGQGQSNLLHPKAESSYAADTWALITDMLSDRHARAKSFGVDSVLSLPFPAAVKTGTSSDFRDTWTVGFTTDYTVATWVGNFNGEPMRQVSGVTGAAPLWSRIMLHLYDHREPAAFPQPKGLVQRPICALSGRRPTSVCPTIVQEYFYPEDLAAYEQQPDTVYQAVSTDKQQYRLNLPAEYNEWLAMQQQPTVAPGTLRIISPRSGDYFLMTPENGASQLNQRLEFKLAETPNKPIEWWLNGEKIATQTSATLFWSLRSGNWTLQARSGESMDQVSFQVGVAEPQPTRRGFSATESRP
jgi:penicillin-binding protein 1C